jgi:hypothetical protein
MATMTYKNQPAIGKVYGKAPLAGTSHVYTVTKLIWPENVQEFVGSLLEGRSLHVCCGKSPLGDVRLDLNEESADIRCDAANMKGFVEDDEFDTVLCDPPYNGNMQWNHDLLKELARVSSRRIVFQHWFIPATMMGFYKKAQDKFVVTAVYVWQPRTYFGRVQVITVFDRVEDTDAGVELGRTELPEGDKARVRPRPSHRRKEALRMPDYSFLLLGGDEPSE